MSTADAVRVLVVDSNTISRVGLRVLLDTEDDLAVVGEIESFHGLGSAVDRTRPDVVVMHARNATATALQAVHRFTRWPGPHRAGMVTLIDELEDSAARWQAAGVRGVLPGEASAGQVVAAVRMVAAGYRLFTDETALLPETGVFRENLSRCGVTPRERDVLQLVARGFTNAEISDALTLSESTVKSHVQHLFDKLDLRNRVHAVIFAYEKGMIQAGHGGLDRLVRTAG